MKSLTQATKSQCHSGLFPGASFCFSDMWKSIIWLFQAGGHIQIHSNMTLQDEHGLFQFIGLREKLQETPIFHGKIYGFLQIFPSTNPLIVRNGYGPFWSWSYGLANNISP